ncbi:MAG: AraC family transcriptional regulator [Spirochaetes bacterium]|nr:AraC family transcriptional regulator [Spirochaetota bacterium]
MHFDSVLRVFIAAGALFLIASAIGHLILPRRNWRNIGYAVFLASIGLMMLGNANVTAELTYAIPSLALAETPAIYAIGPACYIIFHETVSLPKPVGKAARYHLLLPVAMVFWTIPYLLLAPEQKFDGIRRAMLHKPDIYHLVHFVGILLSGTYFALMMGRVVHLFRWRIIRDDFSVRVLFYVFVFAMAMVACATIGFSQKSFTGARIACVLGSFFVFGFYILGFRHAAVLANYQIRIQLGSRKSLLKAEKLPELEAKLSNLMTEERLYTDPELSLNTLAQKLDVSLSQLSEYLNTVRKVNFHQFVGRYRIEAAQKLLAENPKMSIIEAAFEVGYNTLSSFNRMFKTITGKAPRDFRRGEKTTINV